MEQSIVAGFGRYLAGEMNALDKQAFERSLEADQQLMAEFRAYKQIWDNSIPAENNWDTDRAWSRFEASRSKPNMPARSRSIPLYWSIAAAVLLLVGVGYFVLLKPKTDVFRYSENGNNAIELKDGSEVHLNHGSALTVHAFGKKRHVELSGEAHFEVAPNAAKPFIIDCGSTITEVIGTSFTLKEEVDRVSIYVISGKVIFRTADASAKEALALTAGEAATYANDELQLIPKPDPNFHAWHTRQLWFNGMTMAEAIAECSAYFNTTIRIENEAIGNCPAVSSTMPFKNPEINSLLNSIARSINAEVILDGDVYVIKGGTSCQ